MNDERGMMNREREQQILPADIPADARTVITWCGAPELIDVIQSHCPELRRLYLIKMPADRPPAHADNVIKVLHADPTQPMAPQIQPVWEAEPLFFAEGRVALHLPADFQRQYPPFAAALQIFCLEFLRGFFSNMAFRAIRGWHMLENIFLNIPALPRARPFEELEGCARNRPAIVIGAGPALDQNIELLRQVQPGALLIACDSAWLPLDRAGIVPDLVVSTDAGDLVWRFWAVLSARQRQTPLVALLQSGWPAVHHHPGTLYLCRGRWPGYDAIEREFGRQIDALDTGQCVGHAAFELARRLGANPIIMAGFNLAYQDDRFHPRHMAAPVFHDTPPAKENLLNVPGIDGRPVTTDLSMAMYLREFERRIAAITKEPGRMVWDATGAGARKQGAQIVDHATVIQKCQPAFQNTMRPAARSTTPGATVKFHPQQCAAALTSWRDAAENLIRQIDGFYQHVRRNPNDPKNFMAPYPDAAAPRLLEIMAGALNQRLAAELHFARADFARTGHMPARLPEITGQYFQDMRHIASVIAEAATRATQTRTPDTTHMIALLPAGDTPAGWDAIQNHLTASRMQVTVYQGELEDIPRIWRLFHEHNAGIALTVEDTIMPAAWHLPGQICLNLRYQPPNTAVAFNQAENWMPGYTVIAMNDTAARAWADRLPPDIPMYTWQTPDQLRAKDGVTPCSWPEITANALTRAHDP